MLAPQFPHVCTQIAGRSIDDFYAAFPRDAAQNTEPTVIARWHQGGWHFITRVPGFLHAKMHADRDNRLWICNGDELICYTPDGGRKLAYPLREPIRADGLAEGAGDTWSILHSSNKLLTIDGNSQSTTTLSSIGDLTVLSADDSGRFWAGGNSRSLFSRIGDGAESPLLIGFDGETKKKISIPKSEGGINILLNHSNGELYVSISKGPIFHANAKALWSKEAKLQPLSPLEGVSELADDLQEGLYALNANQLHHLPAGQSAWTSQRIKIDGNRCTLRCVCAFSDGLAVGTYNGVIIGPKWHPLPLIDETWYARNP
ncbi:MAG TPA: hypothetical protein VGH19_06425 [Verrucomicrobiae bacterium]